MALAQQGKHIDEKLLDNYVNRGSISEREREDESFFASTNWDRYHLELPIPTLDSANDIEDRFIRLLRENHAKNTLFYRYGDLCALDTIQVDLAPEMKGSHLLRYITSSNERSSRCNHSTFRLWSDQFGMVLIFSFFVADFSLSFLRFRDTKRKFSVDTTISSLSMICYHWNIPFVLFQHYHRREQWMVLETDACARPWSNFRF